MPCSVCSDLYRVNPKFKKIQVGYLILYRLFLVIVGFSWLLMGRLWKNIQYMLEFFRARFSVLHFCCYICDLPDNFICNIAINAENTTPYSECEQACNLWQQLVLASLLKSSLQDIIDRDMNWFVDFNAGKTQFVLPI